MAKMIAVIETDCVRGKGIEENPMRMVMQYFDLNGKLLAEYDPCSEKEEPKMGDLKDGMIWMPKEIFDLYEFMVSSFSPFTTQQQQIDISLSKAKKAVLSKVTRGRQ